MEFAAVIAAKTAKRQEDKTVDPNGLFGKTIALLERSLNLRSLQHRVLASNIANMDTPNFKAFELVVSEEMARSQKAEADFPFVRTHAGHLPRLRPPADRIRFKSAKPPEFSLRGDGNTVDIEQTMGKLAKNTLMYNAAAQLISKKFNGLKNVMKGGTS
jgi:flagellar basal-body rod protein FlgB